MTAIFGYLDPGSGSMLLQVIVAGTAGALVAVKCLSRAVLDYLQAKWSGSKARSGAPNANVPPQ